MTKKTNMRQAFTIGQLARNAKVSVETIRYYERRGLIAQPAKPARGCRAYPTTTLSRILFIKRAQELGFTLDEIDNLLSLGDSHCSEVQALAESKLATVQAKMNDLRRLEQVLTELVTQCRATPANATCPIVASLQPLVPFADVKTFD